MSLLFFSISLKYSEKSFCFLLRLAILSLSGFVSVAKVRISERNTKQKAFFFYSYRAIFDFHQSLNQFCCTCFHTQMVQDGLIYCIREDM